MTQGAGHGMETGREQMFLQTKAASPLQRSRTGLHRSLTAQAAASTGCRGLVALCLSPATRLHPLKPLSPSQQVGSILSAVTWRAEVSLRTRTRPRPPGVTAALPSLCHGGHPQTGHGTLPSLSWSRFQQL